MFVDRAGTPARSHSHLAALAVYCIRVFCRPMMSFAARIREKIAAIPLLGYIAIFLLAAAVFAYMQISRTFMDPDSFYHVKMAMLMHEYGIIREFPWLPFTTLSQAYADHHFLYHLALIPFVTLFSPLFGMKVATVFFAAAAMTAFYALLRVSRVRFSFLLTLILISSGGFIFRLNLAKTSAISIMFLMLAVVAMLKEKRLLLFIMSWFFVWLYGGWPLMLVVAGAFLVGRSVAETLMATLRPPSWWQQLWQRLTGRTLISRLWTWPEVKNFLTVAAGLSAGVVINPFFPKNLSFYWEQIVQIAVINYNSTIGVGNEWYPYTVPELFGRISVIFIIFAIIVTLLLAVVFWSEKQPSFTHLNIKWMAMASGAGLLALFFTLMTLRSRRHIEYCAPFLLYFEALLLSAVMPAVEQLRTSLTDESRRRKVGLAATLLVVYLALFLPLLMVRDVIVIGGVFRQTGLSWSKYEKAAEWLRNNTPPDSVVFHSDWDDFPLLFYQDDRNRYISGLDPTFLYRQDPIRFQQFVDITTGKRHRRIAQIIVRLFDSRYVLVEHDHEAMRGVIEADTNFQKVYEDDQATIYSIPKL
jgi:hypothetical protein